MREIASELPDPDIVTHFSVEEDGRGRIDLFLKMEMIGQEFIETSSSWREEGRLGDYRKVLNKKVRLVVMAPLAEAMKVRMMMLELNNWWMFNYLVYGYDAQGRLVSVLRPEPPDRQPSYVA